MLAIIYAPFKGSLDPPTHWPNHLHLSKCQSVALITCCFLYLVLVSRGFSIPVSSEPSPIDVNSFILGVSFKASVPWSPFTSLMADLRLGRETHHCSLTRSFLTCSMLTHYQSCKFVHIDGCSVPDPIEDPHTCTTPLKHYLYTSVWEPPFK
jgi:hypothetical protein